MPAQARLVYEAGSWEIDAARRELRSRGVSVPIGHRAFEIIETLVNSAGEVVSKDDLMDRVWPGAVVEDATLQVHISAIRKAFGADRTMLKTQVGRGYRLMGSWTARAMSGAGDTAHLVLAPPPAGPVQGNLPVTPADLVGRRAAVQHLQDLMSAYRLVTLTGPGGIGKTRLALEVAHALRAGYEDDVWQVELAALSDPGLVAAAIAGALGLDPLGNDSSPETLARAIGSRRLLLMIDNCEHVIDAAATVVETLMRRCPGTAVLATSRELLRVDGEFVYRVPPLELPVDPAPAADDVLQASAVQLFLARTGAWQSGVQQPGPRQREQLLAIAAICRRLDGIPLAIEFAAARAAVLGPEQVLARLDDRFALLTSGRRTALPKQRTLRAVLDWSYGLLSDGERELLQRLAVFVGTFTLAAADAVARSGEAGPAEVADGIANLVEKSLLTPNVGGDEAQFRLLETTRAYALDKLQAAGALRQFARGHAEYYRGLLAARAHEREATAAPGFASDCRRHLDEVHAALDWAGSDAGDAAIAAALTIAAVPLWFEFSLMAVIHDRVGRALPLVEPGSRQEMLLLAALGESLLFARGNVPEAETAWTAALAIADRIGDRENQLRALWGLYFHWTTAGDFRVALELAERFRGIAAGQPDAAEVPIGDRMAAVAHHFLGDQAEARRHIDSMLDRYTTAPRSHRVRFQVDQRIGAQVLRARILWLQGFPDTAMQTANATVEQARSLGHVTSLGYALAAGACPVAFLAGDLAAADALAALLSQLAAQHGLALWHDWGRNFSRAIGIRRGELTDGLELLRAELDAIRGTRPIQFHQPFLAELAQGFGRAGEVGRGLEAIDEALAASERAEERWYVAELLRIKADLMLLRHDHGGAEALFTDSLRWARAQSALSWELRTAVSLARHRRDAHGLLAEVYGRFTEGFDTADMVAAKEALVHT